jgi:hypothetical protein
MASFWAEAAVMAALTDPETGSDSAFSVSLLFLMFLTTGWQYFSLSSYATVAFNLNCGMIRIFWNKALFLNACLI